MNKKILEGIVYFAAIFLALALHSSPALDVGGNEASAASVLFEQYETVFHTVPSLLMDNHADLEGGFLREPFNYLDFALDHRSQELQATLLKNADAVFLGTKDYIPPDGLGRIVSTRCFVTVLKTGSNIDFIKYLGRPDLQTVNGFPLWMWSVDMDEFGDGKNLPSTLFATQIGNSFFVVSNDLSDLQAIAQEMASFHKSEPSDQIREWGIVKRHQFWGYRKYKSPHLRAPDTVFNGLKGVQPEAEGLIMYADLEHKIGVLRFLSSRSNDSTPNKLSEMLGLPSFKYVGDREWETQFPLSTSGAFPDSSLKVWWLFGLGVVV